MADEITLTVTLPTDSVALTISEVAGLTSSSFIVGEVPTGTKNSINKVFAIANAPVADTEVVQLGQTIMRRGTDYTLVGTVLTMITYAPTATEYFAINYVRA